MKTPVSKDVLSRMALCVCVLSALPIARASEPITIPMTADRWQTKENAEFLRQLGFYHGLMRLNSGNAVLKGIAASSWSDTGQSVIVPLFMVCGYFWLVGGNIGVALPRFKNFVRKAVDSAPV